MKLSKSSIKDARKDVQFAERFSTTSLRSSFSNNKETNLLRQNSLLNDSFSSFELDGGRMGDQGNATETDQQDESHNINLNNPINKSIDESEYINRNMINKSNRLSEAGKLIKIDEIRDFLEKFDARKEEVLGSHNLDDTISVLEEERERLKSERNNRSLNAELFDEEYPMDDDPNDNDNNPKVNYVRRNDITVTLERMDKTINDLTKETSSSKVNHAKSHVAKVSFRDSSLIKVDPKKVDSYLKYNQNQASSTTKQHRRISFKASNSSERRSAVKEEDLPVMRMRQPTKSSILMNKQLMHLEPLSSLNFSNPRERWPVLKGTLFYENMTNDEVLMTK